MWIVVKTERSKTASSKGHGISKYWVKCDMSLGKKFMWWVCCSLPTLSHTHVRHGNIIFSPIKRTTILDSQMKDRSPPRQAKKQQTQAYCKTFVRILITMLHFFASSLLYVKFLWRVPNNKWPSVTLWNICWNNQNN